MFGNSFKKLKGSWVGWALIFVCLLSAQASFAASVDVTNQVEVSRSGFVLNRSTGTFDAVVTVKNTGSALVAPVRLAVANVTPDSITLVNATGTTDTGLSYVDIPVSGGRLGSGVSATAVLKFKNPSRVSFIYTTEVFADNGSTTPTTVASQAVDNSIGGTVSVNFGTIAGTSVNIPAGALTVSQDTIQIGYSATLPAPQPANSISAGIIPISKTFDLATQSGKPFNKTVEVTVPYDAQVVGINDYPVVFYWDANANRYEAVETVAIDRSKSLVTFKTKHFSAYVVFVLPNLLSLINNPISTTANAFQVVDSGFRPNADGFRVLNFSTRTGAARGAACYGMTTYSAWYYANKKATSGSLFNKWDQSDPITASLGAVPIEEDIARELIYATFNDTIWENRSLSATHNASPSQQLISLLSGMILSGSPQLVGLYDFFAPTGAVSGHSVLAYRWDASLPGFYIYDPNHPYDGTSGYVKYIKWNSATNSFVPYQDDGYYYQTIEFDSTSSHIPPSRMQSEFDDAESGWPSKRFNELKITVPVAIPASGAIQSYPLDPSGTTVFTLDWTPKCIASDPAECVEPSNLSAPFAHVYLDGIEVNPILNGATSVTAIPVPLAHLNATVHFSFSITLPPGTPPPSEMVVVISDSDTIAPGSQLYISHHYDGFLRVSLSPPISPTVVLDVMGTLPGWDAVPSTITLTGMYPTSAMLFAMNGTKGNTCGSGERGSPLFSTTVDVAAAFFGATSVTGVPYESAGPFINRRPCSSFFAKETDANGNGKIWLNATGRAWQIIGMFISDWEYQVRYYSGDPALNYSDKKCTVGLVANAGFFAGQPVQCNLRCDTPLLGKLPANSPVCN